MHAHHAESIENLLRMFQDDPDVLAIFLGGSIAKQKERVDSDVDAIIIVTEEKHRVLAGENRLSECIHGHCPYPGGYFDLKYSTKEYLQAVAERGSEPSRNAFMGAKCLFSRDPELETIAAAIPVFQVREKEEKMLSFYSSFVLSRGYFWKVSGDDPYLKTRSASDAVLYGLRMILQENEVLFPCHKALMDTVAALPVDTSALLDASRRFLTELTNDAKDAYVRELLAVLRYQPPKDYSQVLTRFIDDNELWWYKDRPVIAEW